MNPQHIIDSLDHKIWRYHVVAILQQHSIDPFEDWVLLNTNHPNRIDRFMDCYIACYHLFPKGQRLRYCHVSCSDNRNDLFNRIHPIYRNIQI